VYKKALFYLSSRRKCYKIQPNEVTDIANAVLQVFCNKESDLFRSSCVRHVVTRCQALQQDIGQMLPELTVKYDRQLHSVRQY
jgi:hypothetical protein